MACLGAAGVVVTATRGLQLTGVEAMAPVSTRTLVELATEVCAEDPSACGVFISSGGLLTLGAICQLENRLSVPVTAGPPAGSRGVVRLCAWDATALGCVRLFALR